jgi:hypothetical protein
MEVLLLVVILGIIGVAAGSALQSVAKSAGQTDASFQIETQLISKMEQIRAMPFDSIALGTPNPTLTDAITINGTLYARTVNVILADGNGDGVLDANFKQITDGQRRHGLADVRHV